MSPSQQRLVRDNLGLVAMHVRRHIRPGHPSRRDREWEDLFQEGCIGLMRAARTFKSSSGRTFPAFALPRIRTAVDRAFRGAFATVHCPLYPRAPGREGQTVDRTTVISLDFDPPDRRSSPRHHPATPANQETVGQRLRDRYEEHVHQAARSVTTHRMKHTLRRQLLHQLIQHRMLVPDTDQRLSLRRIARQIGLSYTRVLSCDNQLKTLIHRRLDDDSETHCLRDLARQHPDGWAALVDRPVRRHLLQTRLQAFLGRLTTASPDHQAQTLLHLIHQTNSSISHTCRRLMENLHPTRQNRILTALCAKLPSPPQHSRIPLNAPEEEA